jgi:hypothetical protein
MGRHDKRRDFTVQHLDGRTILSEDSITHSSCGKNWVDTMKKKLALTRFELARFPITDW